MTTPTGFLARITLAPSFYEARRTVGGGETRDLMPYEGAVGYVYDGRYGIEYAAGDIDWLGSDLSHSFGDCDSCLARCPSCGEVRHPEDRDYDNCRECLAGEAADRAYDEWRDAQMMGEVER